MRKILRKINGEYVNFTGGASDPSKADVADLSTIAFDDNVNISSPTDGQALTYDGTSGKWINSTPNVSNPSLTSITEVSPAVRPHNTGDLITYDDNIYIVTQPIEEDDELVIEQGDDQNIKPVTPGVDIPEGTIVYWNTDPVTNPPPVATWQYDDEDNELKVKWTSADKVGTWISDEVIVEKLNEETGVYTEVYRRPATGEAAFTKNQYANQMLTV